MNPADYYGFPQRFVVGLPTEETPLVLASPQRLKLALDYLTGTAGVAYPSPRTQDGKASVFAGNGGIQARVYRPTTEEQAQRNLNFAIANLSAYVEWDQRGRAEQARIEKEREENLRKAEAEAAKEKARQARLKAGLDLYNKTTGSRALTWGYTPVGPVKQEEWAKKAEELADLQRRSNPYTSSIFNAGGLGVDGRINAANLLATSPFRF